MVSEAFDQLGVSTFLMGTLHWFGASNRGSSGLCPTRNLLHHGLIISTHDKHTHTLSLSLRKQQTFPFSLPYGTSVWEFCTWKLPDCFACLCSAIMVALRWFLAAAWPKSGTVVRVVSPATTGSDGEWKQHSSGSGKLTEVCSLVLTQTNALLHGH